MTASTNDPVDYDGYGRLVAEVKRRWHAPRNHPTYMAYFIGSFVLFAAVGAWLELAKILAASGSSDWGPLRTAIATYFPAILGSVAMQLSISDAPRSLRAWGHIFAGLFLALSLFLIVAPNLRDWAAILLGLVGSAAALAFWWVVNADEAALRDDIPLEAAVGGKNPEAPLLGQDDLDEFQS